MLKLVPEYDAVELHWCICWSVGVWMAAIQRRPQQVCGTMIAPIGVIVRRAINPTHLSSFAQHHPLASADGEIKINAFQLTLHSNGC
jgi:hypothetical protein